MDGAECQTPASRPPFACSRGCFPAPAALPAAGVVVRWGGPHARTIRSAAVRLNAHDQTTPEGEPPRDR